jgi:predicted phage-related endonuclease
MLCTGSTWGIIVRLVKGWELQWYVYERNTEMCNDIINAATDFWNRFDGILEGKDYWYPPETTEEASKIYKGNGNLDPVNMDGNNMLSELIEEYVNADKSYKDAKENKDEASKAIKSIMKEHEVVSFNGFIISHKTMSRKKTKMVEVPGAEPIVMRRFSIKDAR